EDTILFDPASGYAANIERAHGSIPEATAWTSAPASATLVHTPDVGAIADVMAYLKNNGYADVSATRGLKCVLFMATTAAGSHSVAAFARGDRDVSEAKLTSAVTRRPGEEGPVLALRPMHPEEVRSATGARPGFAGPGKGLTVAYAIADSTLKGSGPLVAGANQDDHHLVGFVLERDAAVPVAFDDILVYRSGDASPAGTARQERRGIEVGHVFKVGTKYSAAMEAVFTGEDGKRHPFIMGCYGIGSWRVVAAA